MVICLGCATEFTAKHAQARWCGKACYDHHRRWPARRERILAAVARRPRCVICDAPIRYGDKGVSYRSTTCGNRACAVRRNHWYGPITGGIADKRLRNRLRDRRRAA